MIRVGTAGWSVPRAVADQFPTVGSGLQRYAARFSFAEIDTSFYRPHRRTTYERWAATTPDDFRFAVKLPKTVTHDARLGAEGHGALERFLDEAGGLGAKLGPLVVQLAPSLKFDAEVAGAFFANLNTRHGGDVVCEPRHASWFTPEAEALLAAHRVARVAADPARALTAGAPGGFAGFSYHRLHGSPVIYRSPYPPAVITALADGLKQAVRPAWVVFDNTALGHAAEDALTLKAQL